MRCNLCGFSLPSPDTITVALMKQHLYEEHDIQRFRPVAPPPAPSADEDDRAAAWGWE